MTRIYLIRHAQTIWNNVFRYQGHSDIELSETGRRQARLLAKRLEKVEFKAVYSSDLWRAQETAEILAAYHNLTPTTLTSLREINFGDWEGLTFAEITENYQELANRWYLEPGEIQIPGGETFTMLRDRTWKTIKDLVKAHQDHTIALVTHAGSIRAIICALLDIDLNCAFRLRQDNCALNILDFFDDQGMLSLLNDTHHLAELEV